jgi:N-acetylglucosaminyl-diphospho-decaprenol L-rhamnosyltransferase
MNASIDVIIVNWNTRAHLRECLKSIATAEGAEMTRVAVVDNASSDGSANGLDDLPLPLEVIRNERNVGFAAACNQAAADSTADYLLFLNPDARLFPDTLVTVVDFMESEQSADIGICGVQVIESDGTPGISCSRFPTLRVMFGKLTGLQLILPQVFSSQHLTAAELPESQVVDQVIGAFYFVRRDLFTQLGGFDERYFIYFEDVDFALRARRHGYRSYFLKEARVFHVGNVSSNQVRDMRLYHSLRSRLLFAYEYWPNWQANALVVLTLTVELAARLIRAALHGSASEISATAAGYSRLLGDLSGWKMRTR